MNSDQDLITNARSLPSSARRGDGGSASVAMTANGNRRSIVLLATGCLLLSIFAGRAAAQSSEPLTWRGCGITEKAFMRPCAEAYTLATGQTITISGGGAALGIRSAAGRSADMGGSCRHCLPDRFESESGLISVLIAWDALVVVAHPSNPVDGLSRDQLEQILRGGLTSWKDVGGTEQSIIVGGRKGDESGVGVMMRQLIVEEPDFEYSPNAILLRSSGPLEQFVEKSTVAIAITGVSSAKKRELKVLDIDGVSPTRENIAAGLYPYFRPLYLYYRPDSSERVQRFVDWILSPSGQSVIEEQGTVTLAMGLRLMSRYEHWGPEEIIENLDTLRRQALALAEGSSATEATSLGSR